MKIEIYGTGCAKCKRLAQAAELAARELGVDYQLEKIEDLDAIVAAGVMRTPALAVDGELRVSGQLPSVSALRGILSAASAPAAAS